MKRSRWMRLRYWLTDNGAPRWVRILAARPSEYMVARRLWEWPRRYALLDTLATLCGRTNYRTPTASLAAQRRRVKRELHEQQVEAVARDFWRGAPPLGRELDALREQFERPYHEG